jgi:cell division protein FtsB
MRAWRANGFNPAIKPDIMTLFEFMSAPDRTTSWVPLAAAAALAVAAVMYTVLSPDGLLQWFRLRREVAVLTAENEALRHENETLRGAAQRLAGDKEAVERAVRAELGYVRKDEVVFKFAPPATGSQEKR